MQETERMFRLMLIYARWADLHGSPVSEETFVAMLADLAALAEEYGYDLSTLLAAALTPTA